MAHKFPIIRKDNLVVKALEREMLIYDLKVDKVFLLNETAAFVLNALDGKKGVSEISELLSQHFNEKSSEEVVWLAIDLLKSKNLVIDAETENSPLEGLTRRQAVKKAGLSTMIALPIISSLVAPVAANAVSGGVCSMSANVCYGRGSSICTSGCDGRTYNYLLCTSTDGSCMNCFVSLSSTCGTIPIVLSTDIIIASV